MQTVTLSLFRFASLADRLWVLGQMAAARPGLARLPGLEFWKLCGSGTGEGFTPRPDTAVWAILGAWRDAAAARAALDGPGVFGRWRARAAESWTVHLQPLSARGRWSGVAPFRPAAQPADAPRGPLAVLTRASLRPSRLLRFWGRVPAISQAIGTNPDVAFKIGIGEMPWLHQVTFSIWPDARRMAAFAHAAGPHAAAVRAVREGDWFAEELYARFAVTAAEGRWHGADPLAGLVSGAAVPPAAPRAASLAAQEPAA